MIKTRVIEEATGTPPAPKSVADLTMVRMILGDGPGPTERAAIMRDRGRLEVGAVLRQRGITAEQLKAAQALAQARSETGAVYDVRGGTLRHATPESKTLSPRQRKKLKKAARRGGGLTKAQVGVRVRRWFGAGDAE